MFSCTTIVYRDLSDNFSRLRELELLRQHNCQQFFSSVHAISVPKLCLVCVQEGMVLASWAIGDVVNFFSHL